MSDIHDLIIVGGGPAGLTAGLYAARARLTTLLIEQGVPGGQIVNAELVENYPGFPDGISGFDLASSMERQAAKYGLEVAMGEVTGFDPGGKEKVVQTTGGTYRAGALIIAGGSEHAKLGVPGEEELRGKGVSYCATCDGAFFRDQVVAVVGGGNVALNDALFLTRFGSRVIVIHRRDQLRATRILQERAFAHPKIEFLWDTVVKSIESEGQGPGPQGRHRRRRQTVQRHPRRHRPHHAGEGEVSVLRLTNVKSGEESMLEASGVFIAVGLRPNTGYLQGVLALTPEGFILVDGRMATDRPGVFAAGDIRAGSPRQVSSAVGDGAIAAISAEEYLSSAS
jgi:thioredoxin reductase (NADPH)